MKLSLWIFNPDEIWEIFRKWENLSEKEEKFFKNLLFEVPENNILRILKNKKIIEINDDFLEEKIFKIIKKEKKVISILWDFLAKYHEKDFWNEFIFSYIFEKLINSQKIILEEKSKKWEYENKKMEKKYFIIKKVLWI